jgi:Protein of unknown function (DUF664).
MNTFKIIESLERFGTMLPDVLRDVGQDDARWKPADGAWSILEIVCHLADEELYDFRERVRLTLNDPTASWPPIDPEGWAVERQYNERELSEAVAKFRSLRSESIAWLRSLQNPDWTRTHRASFGDLHAGDLLAAWAAHDCLHLRQVAKRLFEIAARDAGEYTTRYAGEWRA